MAEARGLLSGTFGPEGIFRPEGGREIVKNRIKEILAAHAAGATDLDTQRFWQQEAVAGRIGISVFKFNRIANGKQLANKHIQKQIAKVLRRPLEEVFPVSQKKARV